MGFRLGSIPVRVHGFFFLTALFLGSNERNPAMLAIWVAIVFVSVLVHELGHALAGKAFGLSPRIDIHGMGGLTSWSENKPLSNGKHIIVSLAGPFAGFLLGGLIYLAGHLGLEPKLTQELAHSAYRSALFVNIGWGIFNLLPMLPLDGGNVMRSVLASMMKSNADKAARGVSIAMAVLLGGFAFLTHWWWVLMLAVLYGFSNVQALRRESPQQVDEALAATIENAHKALQAQDGKTAATILRPALVPEASRELRALGTRMLAYALLLEGAWSELMHLIEADPSLLGGEELARFARTARELGRPEEADRIEAFAKA